MSSPEDPAGRRPYHHGDLRNALVRAAAELAEREGPDAVTIRAAARAVGVTPTATYRHFANQAELLQAAHDEAQERMTAVIVSLLDEPAPDADPATVALARLTAAGRGYIRFAVEQPGLFRTAFCPLVTATTEEALEQRLAASSPYAFLSTVLDELVDAGLMDPAIRPNAEAGAWAAVHGLSMLLIDGAYRDLPPEDRDAAIDATLAMVVRGLTAAPADRAR